MPQAHRPEFEASFGSRSTEQPIEPQPREGRDDTDDVTAPIEEPDVAADPAPVAGSAAPTLPPVTVTRVDDAPPDAEEPDHVDEVGAAAKPVATKSSRAGLRWFRIRRRIVAVCAISVVLGLVYYFVSLAQVWTTGRADDDGAADAIVVMGAAQYDGRPSPQLAARLDHVVELWPDGIAPLVVVTGGNLPGDRFTEAEASASYLVERGIPESALILENEGSTSYESLDAVADLLAERGLSRVLIVTDPYHALRSKLIADEVGLDPSVSSTDTSVVTGVDSLRRHLQEAGGVAVGRIIGFDRLSRLVD